MKFLIKSKSLVTIILSMTMMLSVIPLTATNNQTAPDTPTVITPSTHNETIKEFIAEIRTIQQQVFDIAQFALGNQVLLQQNLASNISVLDNDIQRLDTRIQEYLSIVPSLSLQNRDILLVSNALNLIKNGLYTLSLLTAVTTDIQRVTLLDEYFRSRISAKDTLAVVEELLSMN